MLARQRRQARAAGRQPRHCATARAVAGQGIIMVALTVLLAACGGTVVGVTGHTLGTPIPPAPTATATSAPASPTAAVTLAPPPTVTSPGVASPARTAASPTSASQAGGGIVRDQQNVCQLTLPPGYTVDSEGDGFDADDGKGFGALAGATGRADSAAALARSVYASFTDVFTNVQQGAVTDTTDTAQIDFTGALAGHPGQGSVYVRKYGTSVCALSVFTYQDAQVPHERALPALIANLRENK